MLARIISTASTAMSVRSSVRVSNATRLDASLAMTSRIRWRLAAKLKKSLLALAADALGSLRDLLPIVIVISVFQIFVFRGSVASLMPMAAGGLLVVAGLTFFVFGLRLALFPVGEGLAHSLARKGSVFWLLAFAFALGFGTTIAEPALTAVADRNASSALMP